MRVTIRAAHPQDAKAVSKMIREELATPVSASDTAHLLAKLCVSPRHRVFVAVVDELVVGFLHACDYDSILSHYQIKHITAMAVSHSYRRVGIGKALLRRAERWAAESGAAGVALEASVLQTDAHAFFAACGYDSTQHALHYEKMLESGTKSAQL